eukprot:snap_masked-scaffold809_size94238-processed-gene-0.2 protein:Tk02704 transcript:snap_masked-scaffold809_size94238-processed-gene-0.2-mRNA-1 annotation:"adp-ribosylation factor-like protein 4a"
MGAGISKDSLSALSDHMPNLSSHHCAMIGLDSSGKTTVLYRLKFNQYVNTAPTIGFNCEKIRMNHTSYTIWDVGGQDKLRPLWKSYTRCTDGIIFVVDSCKQDRFDEAKLELLRMCKSQNPGSAGKGPAGGHIPVLILANKQDLPNAVDDQTLEGVLGLRDLSNNGVHWHIQPTCAITGDGLEEGFLRLHEMIAKKRKSSSKGGGLKSASSTSKLSSKKVQRSNSHL